MLDDHGRGDDQRGKRQADLLELGNRRLPAQEFRRAAIEKNGGEAESGSEEQLMIRLCASGFGTGPYLGIKNGASHGTGPHWAKAMSAPRTPSVLATTRNATNTSRGAGSRRGQQR